MDGNSSIESEALLPDHGVVVLIKTHVLCHFSVPMVDHNAFFCFKLGVEDNSQFGQMAPRPPATHCPPDVSQIQGLQPNPVKMFYY